MFGLHFVVRLFRFLLKDLPELFAHRACLVDRQPAVPACFGALRRCRLRLVDLGDPPPFQAASIAEFVFGFHLHAPFLGDEFPAGSCSWLRFRPGPRRRMSAEKR